MIYFIKHISRKPIDYQLCWVYILSSICDKENETKVNIKTLSKKYCFNKTKMYRVLGIGITYFSIKENKEYSMTIHKGYLVIKKTNVSLIKKNKKVIKETPVKPIYEQTNEPIKNSSIIKEVITYLNDASGKRFSYKSGATINLIKKRIKEGYTKDDFIKVIDVKKANWTGTEYEVYIRPITLFSSKMDSYLNEPIKKKKENEQFTNTQTAVNEAKDFNWFSER